MLNKTFLFLLLKKTQDVEFKWPDTSAQYLVIYLKLINTICKILQNCSDNILYKKENFIALNNAIRQF